MPLSWKKWKTLNPILMGCMESYMPSKLLAHTALCISEISIWLFYQMKAANMNPLQTWVIWWQDPEVPPCCQSPEIYIKVGSLQHHPPKSQFSSKCCTTYRVISGIKLLLGVVLYHCKFESWLINLLRLALGKQLFSLIIYWFFNFFF